MTDIYQSKNVKKTLKAYKNIAHSFICQDGYHKMTPAETNSLAEKIALAIFEYEKNK